eukprot:2818279-Prymnesium_polylepis.1
MSVNRRMSLPTLRQKTFAADERVDGIGERAQCDAKGNAERFAEDRLAACAQRRAERAQKSGRHALVQREAIVACRL